MDYFCLSLTTFGVMNHCYTFFKIETLGESWYNVTLSELSIRVSALGNATGATITLITQYMASRYS